jgi:hypothetical protein
MIDNKMSVIQRIYWATAEADGNWPAGAMVLLYHCNDGWEYWLHLVSNSVRFVVMIWDGKKYITRENTDVLRIKDDKWTEVFNWEDRVREILKMHELPEDV